LRETDAELGRSSRIIGGMIMRSMQHRLVLFGVAVVFVIVIVLGIYFTFNKYTYFLPYACDQLDAS
jgi:vesicle transport through interaction with t-SNAREs protein 1